MHNRWFVAIPVLIVGLGCDTSKSTTPNVSSLNHGPILLGGQRVVGHINGEGVVNVGATAVIPMDFTMTTILREDGSAEGGAYHHAVVTAGIIEFRTRVTCAAIDPATGRGWIGGVITENNSTDPARQQPRHQVGRDIWWRVVDYGDGQSGTVDRSTFVGFTGDAGIQTSPEYCVKKPWPGPNDTPPQPVDARTGPFLSGNVSVKLKD